MCMGNSSEFPFFCFITLVYKCDVPPIHKPKTISAILYVLDKDKKK